MGRAQASTASSYYRPVRDLALTSALQPLPLGLDVFDPANDSRSPRHRVRATGLSVKVVRAWRSLTSSQPTLLACSGGADSSALAIALSAHLAARVRAKVLIVAHVVHDLRLEADALADRDAAKTLAAWLGLRFVEARIAVRSQRGNAEAVARRLRYQTLADLANKSGCGFVATAHHANDQLETMLMALVRGAGVRGLAGIRESRPLNTVGSQTAQRRLRLIRPMLHSTREDAEAICDAAGWRWQVDATNADVSRLRAAMRSQVVPVLDTLRPGVATRAASTAKSLGEAHTAVRKIASEALKTASTASGHDLVWRRSTLQALPRAALAELLHNAVRRLGEGRGLDRLQASTLRNAMRIIRSKGHERKQMQLAGVLCDVTKHAVTLAYAVQPAPRPSRL
jgi:tRNA(Ile)-lysidine synthase